MIRDSIDCQRLGPPEGASRSNLDMRSIQNGGVVDSSGSLVGCTAADRIVVAVKAILWCKSSLVATLLFSFLGLGDLVAGLGVPHALRVPSSRLQSAEAC